MVEQLRSGFLGLFLVLGQWLSPGTHYADISVSSVSKSATGYLLQCDMQIGWNQELEALVNAGIPLRFRMGAYCSGCDSLVFVRTLYFDVVKTTYYFEDNYLGRLRDSTARSDTYPQVLLALRDFTRWQFVLCRRAESCRIEVELLPSRATRLNRTVDMTAVWGQRKIAKVLVVNTGNGGEQ